LRALEYGAVDIITKPKFGVKQFLEESQLVICDVVKAAASAKVKRIAFTNLTVEKKYSADAIIPSTTKILPITTTDKVVVIGASTGGTEALRDVLTKLPPACPGIVVVQHMPEKFTASFADRLNVECDVQVKEAADGDPVLQGRVLIAPGNRHTLLKRSGARYFVEVCDGELVNRHRPSVDVLFRSTARFAGKNAVGVILTGMGDDGAKGMLEMHDAGAYTIGQDEASCVVYGMPKEAFVLGGVDKVLPLSQIAHHLIQMCK
jgi:two-component system chemotaxis response regulator CheB